MDIVTLIFSTLGTIITEVVSWFSGIFTGVAGLFYVPASGSDPAALTLLGVLSLIGVAVGAFYMVFRIITNLIRVRTGR